MNGLAEMRRLSVLLGTICFGGIAAVSIYAGADPLLSVLRGGLSALSLTIALLALCGLIDRWSGEAEGASAAETGAEPDGDTPEMAGAE